MKERTRTDYIVVHCSATTPDMDIGVKEIDRWHRQRGFLEIGYHAVVRRNGAIEMGRPWDVIGAHVKGYNDRSIGICWVGGLDDDGEADENMTDIQRRVLTDLLQSLRHLYPHAVVVGHRELDPRKECPCFDVSTLFD